jgi:hypothetical protein
MARRFRYDADSDSVVEVGKDIGLRGWTAPPVSDALGFGGGQLADFEADRKANGFSSIEFKPDPSVPEFMQVHAGSRREMLKYAKHRGLVDRSTTSTFYLTEDDMQKARELAGRQFDET